MRMTLPLVIVACFGVLSLDAQSSKTPSLRIIVIEGEGAVNIIQQKTAVAPIVEVRDHNDLPVAGALVRFTIPGGRATFFGARTLTVTTNAAGRATVTGLTPTGSGAFQISASATFQGQAAATTIAQTNVSTAAQAARASSGGRIGGLSKTAIAGIAGAAGAGLFAALNTSGTEALSAVVSPFGTGIRDVTVFTLTAAGRDTASSGYSWDFGDGSSATGSPVTHTYDREGTFQITLRRGGATRDEAASINVVVGSLSGTWVRGPVQGVGHRLVISQQGTALIGSWFVEFEFGSPFGSPATNSVSTLTGTIQSPRTVAFAQSGECQRTIPNGTANSNLSVIGGNGFYGNSSCGAGAAGGDFSFIRQ